MNSNRPAPPTLRQFMACRSPMAFWVTYHVNNPVGAWFAWLAFHARLTPNMVSWISLMATLSGPLALCFWHPSSLTAEAFIIAGCLQLGYTLDGADGMLARVAKQGSRFGQLLDKLIDSIVMLTLPPVLYYAGTESQSTEPFGERGVLLVTFLAILSRGLLATLLWLKEYVERDADRAAPDCRPRNSMYFLRRGVGQLTDTSTFYLLLGIMWSAGLYWWLMTIYSIWILVVWCGYLALTYRDLRRN